ncbi:MAG: hypothetical protein ABIT36_02545 [Steroidobacteraceae bacterium]
MTRPVHEARRLFNDFAYSTTHEIQWKNFASWLLVGGLVSAGFTRLWAIIDTSRAAVRTNRQWIYVSVLLVLWMVHAADAWGSKPQRGWAPPAAAATPTRQHRPDAPGPGLASMGS